MPHSAPMRYDAFGAVSRSSASRYGTFTRTEATAAGMDSRAIARLRAEGALIEPHPGVLVWTSSRPCWEQRLAAALLARGGGSVASHGAAGRLHHLDGFDEYDQVDLTSMRRLRLVGVNSHEAALPTSDVVTVNGFRATNVARTLCDLSCRISADDLERALDSARRAGVSLRWISDTARRLDRPGPAGTRALRQQLEQIRPGERVRGSWFERTVELLLRDPGIPPIARQFEVRDATGSVVARPDLAIPSLRFAVEAHSREFHFGRAAERADEDRDHRLAMVGWDTMYLGFQSTRRPKDTAAMVATAVRARAAQLGVPL